jgi:hypothetical protein
VPEADGGLERTATIIVSGVGGFHTITGAV